MVDNNQPQVKQTKSKSSKKEAARKIPMVGSEEEEISEAISSTKKASRRIRNSLRGESKNISFRNYSPPSFFTLNVSSAWLDHSKRQRLKKLKPEECLFFILPL